MIEIFFNAAAILIIFYAVAVKYLFYQLYCYYQYHHSHDFCYHFPIYYSIHHHCIVTLLLVLPLRFLLFIYICLVHVLAIFTHPFIYLGYLLPYYHIYDMFLLFYCYLQLYIIYDCIIALFTSVRKISPKLIYVILYNITKIY